MVSAGMANGIIGYGISGHGNWYQRAWHMVSLGMVLVGMANGISGHGKWYQRAWQMVSADMANGINGHFAHI